MTRFEYLSVLVSIVIALGISEVTFSWGRLVQSRARITFSALHAFWSVFLLLLMVQFWWGFWNFRTVEHWSFVSLVAVIAEAVTLVLCALVLSPRLEGGENLDLGQLYFDNSRPFFVLGMLLLLQLAAVDALVLGSPLVHQENLFRLPGILLTGVAASSRSKRVHWALPILAAGLFVGFLTRAIRL